MFIVNPLTSTQMLLVVFWMVLCARHFLFAQSGCFKLVSTKLVNMGELCNIDNSLPCDWRSNLFDDRSIYLSIYVHVCVKYKGRFTLWTMKSSHVRGLFCVGRLHGTTSMVRVTKILVFMVHGPFTRCKPNVDHEEWPCTKKWSH
jgi:hypothetical protein